MIEKILIDFPSSISAPEAIFLKGICSYKNTHNPKHLKEAYEQLQIKHPSSQWAKKSYPYSLL